jgi:hypothetical protein
MRFRHILSETRAGLRQNLTMTLAVIMTMWVSDKMWRKRIKYPQLLGWRRSLGRASRHDFVQALCSLRKTHW